MRDISFKLSLILLVLIFAAATAAAGEHNAKKWYAGLALGGANIDTGISAMTGTASVDDTDTGGKLFAGYRFNSYFGLELSYADFGDASIKGSTGDTFTLNGVTYTFGSAGAVENNVNSIGLQGVFFVPLEEITENDACKYVTPFIKAGVNFWDADYSGTNILNTNIQDDDGTSLVFGMGLNVNITPHFVIRGEFERYRAEDDVDLISGALVIRF